MHDEQRIYDRVGTKRKYNMLAHKRYAHTESPTADSSRDIHLSLYKCQPVG